MFQSPPSRSSMGFGRCLRLLQFTQNHHPPIGLVACDIQIHFACKKRAGAAPKNPTSSAKKLYPASAGIETWRYHALSCFIMFYHALWCFMMFYDALWCFMMLYDALSCFICDQTSPQHVRHLSAHPATSQSCRARTWQFRRSSVRILPPKNHPKNDCCWGKKHQKCIYRCTIQWIVAELPNKKNIEENCLDASMSFW